MKKQTKAQLEKMEVSELIYTLLANKIGSVDPKEVFSIVQNQKTGKNVAFIGKEKISAGELSQLKQEGALIEQMRLWKLITKTLYYEAELKMLRQARNERDMDWGKALMHSVGVLENTIYAVKNSEIEV
jgi:hypothetical protein